jgi:hypothetical protein
LLVVRIVNKAESSTRRPQPLPDSSTLSEEGVIYITGEWDYEYEKRKVTKRRDRERVQSSRRERRWPELL